MLLETAVIVAAVALINLLLWYFDPALGCESQDIPFSE